MTFTSHLDSPHVVALTGAIGSGKSTVAAAFAQMGVPCIDSDLVVRRMHQDPGHPATREIARAFPAAMTPDGRLARGSLRTLFAKDPAANALLKRVFRPWVLAELQRWTADQHAPYVIWESALALDNDLGAGRVLVVDAGVDTRLRRIALRNPDWSQDQVRAVLSMQPPRSAYLAGADDVVLNEGTAADAARATAQLHANYLALWSKP